MKIIVGLGNYGAEYAKTRHNIGFMAADIIAEKMNIDFAKEKFHSQIAETNYGGEKILLMKPLTYMNRSGLAVAEAMNFYKLDLADLLVIYDDMDMPCGQLKIKKKGSGGGHKGIGDIINALGSDVISRIKVGIDHPVHDTVVDFVLKPFSAEEFEKIKPTLEIAAKAAVYWLENGTQETMNVYNGYGKAGAQKPKQQRNAGKKAKAGNNAAKDANSTNKDEAKDKSIDKVDKADKAEEKPQDRTKDPKFLAMLKNFFGGKK